MELSEADVKLLDAETAEETKIALEMGADVNARLLVHAITGAPNVLTALMRAKTAEQTKLLLEAGADVNAKDNYGRTALMYAKTAEQTKLLIEAGIDVNAKTRLGETALMFAETAEQTKLLLEAGCVSPLNGALRESKSAEQTKLLIEAGANVNSKDICGRTALRYARTVDQAIILLKSGANIRDLNLNIRLSIEDKFEAMNAQKEDKEIQAQIAKNRERLKSRPKLKGKSGAVIADEIAEKQISGEEKRVITPQVGKELRQEIMKEMNNKKGQRE